MRKLPLVCPSVDDPSSGGFTTQNCTGRGCVFWGKQKTGAKGCTAGEQTSEVFSRWFTPARDVTLPPCAISDRCTWNLEALKRGEAACVPRRLGLTCEHQGGDWNTFMMAEPDDPCWGEDSPPQVD